MAGVDELPYLFALIAFSLESFWRLIRRAAKPQVQRLKPTLVFVFVAKASGYGIQSEGFSLGNPCPRSHWFLR